MQEFDFPAMTATAVDIRHYPTKGGQVMIVERIPRFLLGKGTGGGRESLMKLIENQKLTSPFLG